MKTANSSEPTQRAQLRAKPLRQFLSEDAVVVFLIDDMLRQGWLYTVCGRTGAGKSGFGVLLTLLIASGGMLAGRQCQAGPVLYIAAENPDDVRHRFIVAIEIMCLDEEVIDRIQVVDKSFLLQQRISELKRIIDATGAAAVIVDTDQAVSLQSGANENDNVERIEHARRLRQLSNAASRPTVIDLCHPAGSADNLVPRGGSSFLNEIDGNIRISRNNSVVTIKTDPEKYRGGAVRVHAQVNVAPVGTCQGRKGPDHPDPGHAGGRQCGGVIGQPRSGGSAGGP